MTLRLGFAGVRAQRRRVGTDEDSDAHSSLGPPGPGNANALRPRAARPGRVRAENAGLESPGAEAPGRREGMVATAANPWHRAGS
jgi:hypothetical protein